MRIADKLHGAVVHVKVRIFDFGIILSHARRNLSPKARGFQNIGLVHHAHLFVSLHRRIEAHAQDALDFLDRIIHGVERRIVLFYSSALTEVNAACKLSYDENVQTVADYFGL